MARNAAGAASQDTDQAPRPTRTPPVVLGLLRLVRIAPFGGGETPCSELFFLPAPLGPRGHFVLARMVFAAAFADLLLDLFHDKVDGGV